MSFKIGKPTVISISNVGDQTKESELQRYDFNRDGVLNLEEASYYHASKTGGLAPRSLDDVLDLVGGRQHEVDNYHLNGYSIFNTYAPDWKGDFNLPGLGAGNVRTGRVRAGEQFNFIVDANLMEANLLDHIEEATLFVGPAGFDREAGSNLAESVPVPLSIATRPAQRHYDRAGGTSVSPEKKFIVAAVKTEGLRELANGGDLEFYVQFKTTDGNTHYINKDGQSFNNFKISAHELQGPGQP